TIASFVYLFLGDTIIIEVNPYHSELRIVQHTALPFTREARTYHKNQIKELRVFPSNVSRQKIVIKTIVLHRSEVIDINVSYNQSIITAMFISKYLDIPVYYHENPVLQSNLQPLTFNKSNIQSIKEKYISNCSIQKFENNRVRISRHTFNKINDRWNINHYRNLFGILILSFLLLTSTILFVLVEFQLSQLNLVFMTTFLISNGFGSIILALLYSKTEVCVDKRGIRIVERVFRIPIIKEFIPLEFVSHLESKKDERVTEQYSSFSKPEYEFNLYVNCFIDPIPLIRSFHNKEEIEKLKTFLEKSVFR
ncbi:MAG: hypothetical protein ACTSW1_13755, partial [Candidatus Hodarchaeales archaeon]